MFTADGKRLLCIPDGRTLVAYVVPDGVESIDDGAFSGQSNLARVEIPKTVTAIGENAFWLGAFLTLYGPVADCTAKTYAHDHGLGYNEYRVTFWDGDAELLSALVTAGETIESLTDVVNDYCTFGGWYRDADLTDAWDFEQDTMPAKDLNLYLKWNSDFAVSSSDHGLTITGYVGSSNQIRIPSEIDGTAVVAIADGAFVSTEEKPIASLDIPDSVTTIDTAAASGNPELVIVGNAGSAAESFAQTAGFAFEKRLYQIRYDSNGGTQIQPASYIAGEAVVQPAPVKRNYVFLGWYKDPSLADPWESTDVMPAEDVTLYAKWGLINKSIQGTFSYEMLHDGTISIAAYSGSSSMTNLTIPSEIDGYTVSAISDYAFSDDKYLLKISIPDTVTRIGAYAFADSAIREISGGSNVISLGEACFAGAAGLLQAFLPSGVTEIPDFCFSACASITELALSSSIVSVGDYAFNGCSYLSSVTVPESVQTIGAYAFADCQKLKSVELPSSMLGMNEQYFGNAAIHYYAASMLKFVALQQTTKASVHLAWNEVAGADGYQLYRKIGTEGAYSLVKSVNGTQTDNFSLTSGKTYYYKVVAYQQNGSEKKSIAASDEVGIRIAYLTTPDITEITQSSEDSAQMSWSGINGAQSYEIWRAYSRDGEYTLLKTVNGTSTTNTGLIGGRDYFYKIRALYQADGDVEYSAFSSSFEFHMPLLFVTVPQNVYARETAAGTVYLSWDAVAGADGYCVYRQRGNGKMALVKTITDPSCYNYGLKSGETYSYQVAAYYYEGSQEKHTECSEPVRVKILPVATPQIKTVSQSAANAALITWSSVGVADGYELYRSRSENGTYYLMKSVEGIAATNYNLTLGATYFYKVRAYVNQEGGGREYGEFSNVMNVTIEDLAQTRIKSVVQADTSSAKVTWAATAGAEGYEIWRSVNDTKQFELVRTTSGFAIQDRDLKDGQTYYYKVRAYKTAEDGSMLYGGYSQALSVKVIAMPVLRTVAQESASSARIIWDKIPSAEGYELWRSEDQGKNYTCIKSISTSDTINYKLTLGAVYLYKVRAYYTTENGVKMYSSFSKPMTLKVMGLPNVTSVAQNGSNGVKLVWAQAEYADGYELWRSDSEGSAYTRIKEVTGTSTVNFGLEEGSRYLYMLRPYSVVNGKKIYGSFGSAMGITILHTPVFSSIQQLGTSSCEIKWEAVPGATGYKLYRAASEDGNYKLVKTITDTTTRNYSLTSDTLSLIHI